MRLHIDLETYTPKNTYMRQNKACYFDPVRKKLIQVTPEETVRQQVILYLQEKMGVPQNMIDIEVPISYFQKGAQGRADIIVYEREDNTDYPILVIECKAPNIPLTDKVFNQVTRYDEIILANNIMITNGIEAIFQTWDDEKREYTMIAKVPSYKDLTTGKLEIVTSAPYFWKRPDFKKIGTQTVFNEFLNNGWIGEDTPENLIPFVINLSGCIQDSRYLINPKVINGVKIIEDGGIRFTSFGNAAGGSWDNEYRYFIIQDELGNNQIISIGLFGSMKTENHPKFGNSKGYSTLVVAIDDFEVSHNSLQLNLDKYTSIDGEVYTIWHDGRLTVGNKGAVKRKLVIDYIKEHDPVLIDESERVFLGTFDNSKEITIEDKCTQEFISRLIRYALVRDEFRKYYLENA